MNRTYIPENRYENRYEESERAVAAPVRKAAEKTVGAVEALLMVFDMIFGFFAEPAVRTGLRVVSVVGCFFAFLFVIGAVETGALTFGAGILTSILLATVAFLSVYRRGARKD